MRNKLAIFGTLVIWGVIFALVFTVWSQPIHEYDNEAHQNACETYERAEAPEWYLFQNRCK